ncbi:uncharacterized protein LTR77_009213 [Saxophila tyrrhenica]|uniref:Uncharacterized protein n=1 Tax=Saxophila tyrrhenica TaxID=1690608 RepID=A0AAV9NYT0_9PEZI|nr:hypothetical protein LTR77_009213 [Saxophila tyrrhenica]
MAGMESTAAEVSMENDQPQTNFNEEADDGAGDEDGARDEPKPAQKKRGSRLLRELDAKNMLPAPEPQETIEMPDDEADPKPAQEQKHTTRQSRHGRTNVNYDMKFHPDFDRAKRPAWAAKRLSGSRSLTLTPGTDDETDEESLPSSAKDGSESEDPASDEDDEDDVPLVREPDPGATRRSSRASAQTLVNYSAKHHPQDSNLPGYQHKARALRLKRKQTGRQSTSTGVHSQSPIEVDDDEPDAEDDAIEVAPQAPPRKKLRVLDDNRATESKAKQRSRKRAGRGRKKASKKNDTFSDADDYAQWAIEHSQPPPNRLGSREASLQASGSSRDDAVDPGASGDDGAPPSNEDSPVDEGGVKKVSSVRAEVQSLTPLSMAKSTQQESARINVERRGGVTLQSGNMASSRLTQGHDTERDRSDSPPQPSNSRSARGSSTYVEANILPPTPRHPSSTAEQDYQQAPEFAGTDAAKTSHWDPEQDDPEQDDPHPSYFEEALAITQPRSPEADDGYDRRRAGGDLPYSDTFVSSESDNGAREGQSPSMPSSTKRQQCQDYMQVFMEHRPTQNTDIGLFQLDGTGDATPQSSVSHNHLARGTSTVSNLLNEFDVE